MNYVDFADTFKDFPVIHIADVKTAFSDFDHRRMYEWQKAGYIKKITRNFYVFADKHLNGDEVCFIGNKLREPSYISMEYALSHYSLIPEAVFVFTSITTKHPAAFETAIGNFDYTSIKKPLFFGYILSGQGKAKYKIAEPEKALLDFLYSRSDVKSEGDIRELRINRDVFKEIIDTAKLGEYLAVFKSPTLARKVSLLLRYIQKHD
jgi:predicted transcriptional regulator of viral defense system